MSSLSLLLCLFGMTCRQVFAELGTDAIVGGNYAKRNEFKYHASVVSAAKYRCGAAIIDNFYILTAVHCVVSKTDGMINMHPFSVLVGTNHIKDKHDAILDRVESVYIPKAFNVTTGEDDIATLKLKKGLNLSAHHRKIEKVNLPSANANFDGVIAFFTGFGIQSLKFRKNKEGKWESYDKGRDGKLKYTLDKIVSNAKCAELKKTIYPSWICGQVFQRGRHSEVFHGDSGGILVYEHQVIGILSKGHFTCDETNNPATYIRTSSYVNMIHNVITGKPGDDVIHVKVPQ